MHRHNCPLHAECDTVLEIAFNGNVSKKILYFGKIDQYILKRFNLYLYLDIYKIHLQNVIQFHYGTYDIQVQCTHHTCDVQALALVPRHTVRPAVMLSMAAGSTKDHITTRAELPNHGQDFAFGHCMHCSLGSGCIPALLLCIAMHSVQTLQAKT